MVSQLSNKILLGIIRKFNDSLPKHFQGEATLDYLLDEAALPLADTIYRAMGHWHRVNGECVQDVGFEIIMLAKSLILSGWVADIYLRKARDRNNPNMVYRYREWKDKLAELISFIYSEVMSSEDTKAKEAFNKDFKAVNLIECAKNRSEWGY